MRDISALPVLAAGRASVVVDLGGGAVLRRALRGPSGEQEAAVMRWARSRGVPVPEVLGVEGRDLVLERVEGPTLLERVVADPAAAEDVGRALAGLHAALDGVPAPPGLRERFAGGAADRGGGAGAGAGDGAALLHGDLHPGNVVDSPSGPVLLDWTNASRGPRPADVAETWVLLASAEPDGAPGWAGARDALLAGLLGGVDRAAAARYLPAAAALRRRDPGTTDPEAERMADVARRAPALAVGAALR